MGPWQSTFHIGYTHLLLSLSLDPPVLKKLCFLFTTTTILASTAISGPNLEYPSSRKEPPQDLLNLLVGVCQVRYSSLLLAMGSGDWFKTIISLKKVKVKFARSNKEKGSSAPKKSNASTWKDLPEKESNGLPNPGLPIILAEDVAATRIQNAFRAYRARKILRCLRGRGRLQVMTKGYPVKQQAMITLNYLHSWSKIQTRIQNCRLCMVTEGRTRQKKLENQLKLEAKIHDLEVEWSGGSETMEETMARIHQREEASVKRERAMAYAFSHQWRANPSQYHGLGNYELSKANWGWSWKERWIAARPWEIRAPAQSVSPKKTPSKQDAKTRRSTGSPLSNGKGSVTAKTQLPSGKGATKGRRLSFPAAEKPAAQESIISAES